MLAEMIEAERREAKRAYFRAYRHNERTKHPEKISAYKKAWRRKHVVKEAAAQVRYQLKAKYGLTVEQRAAIFSAQGSCCAICKATEPLGRHGWHIDHCHETKKVRGILCQRCNLMLGHAKDNAKVLSAAVAYLNNGE